MKSIVLDICKQIQHMANVLGSEQQAEQMYLRALNIVSIEDMEHLIQDNRIDNAHLDDIRHSL
jgi:hypothetical protein